jgi:diacylglycerol O-acyltransferase
VAATLPTSLVTRLARQQAQTVDFATSNVRGAPMPLYMAGARGAGELPGRARSAGWRST